MRWFPAACLLVVFSPATAGQARPQALSQGTRAFELSALNVAPGPVPGTRVISWMTTAKPDAPKERVHLVMIVRESGGTPFNLLRLDAADIADCTSRTPAGQIAGWGSLESCRVKKPPVLIGWRVRTPVPTSQLNSAKMEIAIDGLPPEGWLELGLSVGAADPGKDPTDRIVSNNLAFRLQPPK